MAYLAGMTRAPLGRPIAAPSPAWGGGFVPRPILRRPAPAYVKQPSAYPAANAGVAYNPVNRPVKFPTMKGMRGLDDGALAAIEPDAPIFQQEVHFDAPSLTLYIGTNKIAIVPALVSALLIRLIMTGGSKATGLFGFGSAESKPAKAR